MKHQFCVHGHELTPSNIYLRRDRLGAPACRICRNETAARFRERRDGGDVPPKKPPLIGRANPAYDVKKIGGVWHRRLNKSTGDWLPVEWDAATPPNNPPRGRPNTRDAIHTAPFTTTR